MTRRILSKSLLAFAIAAGMLSYQLRAHGDEKTVLSLDVLRDLQGKYNLKDLRVAELTDRASGVIKNEDPVKKTLLLAVENVCDEKPSAVVFTDPYCKTRLPESATCNGVPVPRWRVERGRSSDPNAVCSSALGH